MLSRRSKKASSGTLSSFITKAKDAFSRPSLQLPVSSPSAPSATTAPPWSFPAAAPEVLPPSPDVDYPPSHSQASAVHLAPPSQSSQPTSSLSLPISPLPSTSPQPSPVASVSFPTHSSVSPCSMQNPPLPHSPLPSPASNFPQPASSAPSASVPEPLQQPPSQPNPAQQRFWRRGRHRSTHGSAISIKPGWFQRKIHGDSVEDHSEHQQRSRKHSTPGTSKDAIIMPPGIGDNNFSFSRSVDDLSQSVNGPLHHSNNHPNPFRRSKKKLHSALSSVSLRDSWIKVADDEASSSDVDLSSLRSHCVKSSTSPAFGVPIGLLVPSSLPASRTNPSALVPIFVDRCFAEIEARGLDEEGLYRVSGTKTIVDRLRKQFNSSNPLSVNISTVDVADIASLLKQWLRELPEPVVPFELYDTFVAIARTADVGEKIEQLIPALAKLPPGNFALLRRLVIHLSIVSAHSNKNSMTSQNLAVIFAPTLLQPQTTPESFALSMGNLGPVSRLLVALIGQAEEVFQRSEALTEASAEPILLSKASMSSSDETTRSISNRTGETKPVLTLPPERNDNVPVRGATVPPETVIAQRNDSDGSTLNSRLQRRSISTPPSLWLSSGIEKPSNWGMMVERELDGEVSGTEIQTPKDKVVRSGEKALEEEEKYKEQEAGRTISNDNFQDVNSAPASAVFSDMGSHSAWRGSIATSKSDPRQSWASALERPRPTSRYSWAGSETLKRSSSQSFNGRSLRRSFHLPANTSARTSVYLTSARSRTSSPNMDKQQNSRPPSTLFDRISEMRCSDDSIAGERPLSFHSALSAAN